MSDWHNCKIQPLHVSYASDKGGNTIEVHWYTRKANLHHVRTLNRSGSSSCQQEADLTSNCFPPVNFFRYASEGIQAACDWAYKGVTEGDTLEGKESTKKL